MVEGIVEFNEWQKIELRVAQIKTVEDIPGADKLYKLTLNVGEEIGSRVICSGIKEFYSKEELIGKKIALFLNLKPRLMRGILSEGMLLAAVTYDKDGGEKEVVLIKPKGEVSAGSEIIFTK